MTSIKYIDEYCGARSQVVQWILEIGSFIEKYRIAISIAS